MSNVGNSESWKTTSIFSLCLLTNVSYRKMLRDARMAALTGCAAASCQCVNGRFGPIAAFDAKGGEKTLAGVVANAEII